MESSTTIGDYLVTKLYELGIRHIFGIPGDYALILFDKLNSSPIKIINTCDEQGAGFAADAYARVNGIGAVCVTYGVGALKLANSTAQAFAEESPVVILSGAPGVHERRTHRLLHHKVADYDTQQKVFEHFTIATAVLDNPNTAIQQIDHALYMALSHKRPIYIEVPRDMVNAQASIRGPIEELEEWYDPDALSEALDEAAAILKASNHPVIVVGEEIHRFELCNDILELAERSNVPLVTVMMGKSIVPEDHPLYAGVYMGAIGHEDVRYYVESSDCFILLGVHLTDFNLGMYTCKIDKGCCIHATSHNLTVRNHAYSGVRLQHFVRGLIDAGVSKEKPVDMPHPEPPREFSAISGKQLTLARLFQRLNWMPNENAVVISDVGEALWSGLDLYLPDDVGFYAAACYGSVGFAVPGAIGAQLANPSLRPIVLVGDGAFQMTGMELSAAVRYGLNPIVIIINNAGYGTERPMIDGPFNDLQPWRFDLIPEVIGGGKAISVTTENELEDALIEANEYDSGFFLIDVHIDPMDRSRALQQLAEHIPARLER